MGAKPEILHYITNEVSYIANCMYSSNCLVHHITYIYIYQLDQHYDNDLKGECSAENMQIYVGNVPRGFAYKM